MRIRSNVKQIFQKIIKIKWSNKMKLQINARLYCSAITLYSCAV